MISPHQKERAMDVSQADFRKALGRFATGVTIVTTCDGPRRLGITVNAFSSVSLDPPLILVCIEKTSYLHQVMLRNGYFAVNLLADDQHELSNCFAGHSEARQNFCDTPSHTAVTGAPVLDHSLGWLDCRIEGVYPGGDHSIIVGRVVALGVSEDRPLLYYRGKYPTLNTPSEG